MLNHSFASPNPETNSLFNNAGKMNVCSCVDFLRILLFALEILNLIRVAPNCRIIFSTLNSNDIKELPLMVPKHTTHCMTDKKTELPQKVPTEIMRLPLAVPKQQKTVSPQAVPREIMR